MKFYVVCEDYTNAFCGMFVDYEDAKKREKEVGGYILTYDISEVIKMDSKGEIMDEEVE